MRGLTPLRVAATWPGRPDSRRPAFAGVLACVLLGFAALLAPPQAAHAQAVHEEIWTATLKPRLSSDSTTSTPYDDGLWGWSDVSTEFSGSSLSGNSGISEFSVAGDTVARKVTKITNDNGGQGTLRIYFTGAGSGFTDLLDDGTIRARLNFYIAPKPCSAYEELYDPTAVCHIESRFRGSRARYRASDNRFSWRSNQQWNDRDTFPVRITLKVPGVDSIAFNSAGTDGAYKTGDAVTATVTFTEAVTVTGTPQLTIDVNGSDKVLDYASGSGTAALVFSGYTVAANDEDTDGISIDADKLALNNGAIKASAAGNFDAVLTHDAVSASANHKVDGVSPTLSSAEAPSEDLSKIVLTFSEAIGSVDRTKITVKKGTTTLTTTADSINGSKVEITLMAALAATDTNVTVDLAAGAVTDVPGNANAEALATAVDLEDTVAPTFVSAETLGTAFVELAYDEALDRDSQPATSAFTVKVDGADRGVDTVQIIDSVVRLTLDSVFRAGDTLTVSYTTPGSNPIKDAAGNEAVSLAETMVTNNLKAAPDAPRRLAANVIPISFFLPPPLEYDPHRLHILWATPRDNGRAIEKYQYRYEAGTSVSDSTTWNDIDGSGPTTTSYFLTGLDAYTEYTIEVRAKNEVGYGTAASVTERTPAPKFPKLWASNEEVRESGDPNNRETTMTFTVNVTTTPEWPVGVHYETEDETATGGTSCSGTSPPDYISTEGRVYFGPEELIHEIKPDKLSPEVRLAEDSHEVVVTVCDDTEVDSGETFRLVLRSTQLHEQIVELGEIGPEGKSYKDANGKDEETASATGTILNSETTTEVSIVADAAYGEEGNDIVFTLRRAGDAEGALTVPVTVDETGAMLAADAPESVTFAARERETELRVATDDDGANEADSTVTATLAAGFAWQVAAGAASAAATVLDNDAAPVTSVSASDVTVWSADMTVVDYENGNIGAGSADLLANQGGSAGLRAKWLYYVTGERKLKIAFGDGLDDAESMTLHVGGLSVAFPENSGGDSSFTIEDVDVSWADGESLAAQVSKPSAEAVSTDATLKSLAVSDAAVSPAFDSGTLLYSAVVDAATASVTVSAESNDGDAGVAFAPSEDADAEQAGHQVAVPVGETLATVTVTAADGRTRRAYRLVVTRWPTVAVSFGSGSHTAIEGGGAATVSVSLDADPGRDVTIPLTASPGGGGAAEDYTVPGSVTFAGGGALSQDVEVTAVADDTAEEGESVVLGFGDLPDGVEAGATASAAVALADTAPEASNTAPTGLPEIAGTAEVGGTLTASADDVEDGDGLDNATFAYQWLADDAAIAGATGTTYEAGPGDVGKTLKVRVTFTDDGGTAETLDSAATEAVVDNRPTVTSVTITEPPAGGWTDGDTVQLAFGFSAAVTVTTGGGTPSVALSLDGTARQASYASGTGTTSLTFSYALTADDGTVTAAVAADALAANGGTIRDADGRDANLAHDGFEITAGAEEPETVSPLTAAFQNVPATHDGSGSFSFEVAFSEDVGISYVTMRDNAFEEDEGDVTRALRVDGRHDLWEITVGPDGREAVTIALPGDRACGETGAVCTRGENPRPLSNSPSATVAGPTVAATPTVSISDASGTEGDGDIAFTVTLDSAGTDTVTVDYATSNGTADGDDYTATSGTVTFVAGTTRGTITVPIADDEVNEGDETFTVALSNASGADLGTGTATGTIQNRNATPLMASFGNVPAEHDGSEFTFALTFSEEPRVGYRVLRDDAFAVTGGSVERAQRQTQGSDRRWTITVKPLGHGDVSIGLPATTDCDAEGAICTDDERPLSNRNSATVRALAALSVADAAVTEAAGASIDFVVSLSRAAAGTVTVEYVTADGSATAGADYTTASGTLTFSSSQTSKTVPVTVLDDVHDDDGETFTLRLSNAAGARIADSEATGTIVNTDPLPKGWLARFGRASAAQVVDLLNARFDEVATVPAGQMTLGGRSMPFTGLSGMVDRSGGGTGQTPAKACTAAPGRVTAEPAAGQITVTAAESVCSAGGTSDPMASLSGWDTPPASVLAGTGTPSSVTGIRGFDTAEEDTAGQQTQPVGTAGVEATPLERALWQLLTNRGSFEFDKRRFISQSSFDLSLSDLGKEEESIETVKAASDRPGQWSLWGRGAMIHFSGTDEGVNINGDVLTGLLGVDYARNRWLAGVALAYHDGDGTYRSARNGKAGVLDSTLITVNPYLRYTLADRLSVWGTLGYGQGTLRLRPERDATVPQESIDTDMQMSMGALGLSGIVYAGAHTELALKSDALWVRTSSDETQGLRGVERADTSRVRLLLSGSHQRNLPGGAALAPSFELGIRYDDGDAERGFGMELGGGLRYADPVRGLAVETRARALVAHEDGGYEEWGLSGSLTLDPGRLGRGLALRLESGWGMTQSGTETLWQRQTTAGLAPRHSQSALGRFKVEMGYGLDVPWTYGILTPYSGVEMAGGNRTLKLGWRFDLGQALSLSLDGERRETAYEAPDHILMLRTSLPW